LCQLSNFLQQGQVALIKRSGVSRAALGNFSSSFLTVFTILVNDDSTGTLFSQCFRDYPPHATGAPGNQADFIFHALPPVNVKIEPQKNQQIKKSEYLNHEGHEEKKDT
jgi:hypothetical protein